MDTGERATTEAERNSAGAVGLVEFVRRSLIIVALVALAVVLLMLLWYAGRIFLMAFAGLLLAVFLRMLTEWVGRATRLSHGWSLAIVIVLLLGLAGLGVWKLQDQLMQQAENLAQTLPSSLERVRTFLEQRWWGRWILEEIPENGAAAIAPGDALSRVTGVASSVFSFVAAVVVIVFVGIYVAVEPKEYRTGLVRLAPLGRRQRVVEVLAAVDATLRWWIIGQLISMALVGLLTGVGLWLLGIELALVLALLAAVLEIVPYFGPILAFTPAALVALLQGPDLVLWVAVVFIVIQFVESYLVLPLMHRRTIWLPPALTIIVMLLMGTLGGVLGVLTAPPLTATVIVLVKMLYLQDTLGDRSVELATEAGE
jgi:predicted PurR-regulated permease PerM